MAIPLWSLHMLVTSRARLEFNVPGGLTPAEVSRGES
jgi:hypothetical protein